MSDKCHIAGSCRGYGVQQMYDVELIDLFNKQQIRTR